MERLADIAEHSEKASLAQDANLKSQVLQYCEDLTEESKSQYYEEIDGSMTDNLDH